MRLMVILATLVLAAAAGACGSDEKRDRKRAPTPAEDFQRRAGEICTDVNDRIVAMEARIQEKTRTARDDAVIARLDNLLYHRYERFVGELVRRLAELEAKAPDKAAFGGYLARLRRIRATAKTVYDAEIAGRRRAAYAAFNRIRPQLERAEDVAERLKLAPCGELSNPTLTGSA